MALKKDRIEIYKSKKNGQYAWRYKAKNGERVAVAGETYANRKHAVKMANDLFREKIVEGQVEVIDLTSGK